MNVTEIITDDGKVIMHEVMMWLMLLVISFLTGNKIPKVKTRLQQWSNRYQKDSE